MNKLGFFVIIIILIWLVSMWAYNCGEYAGQAAQYSYDELKKAPIFDIVEDVFIEKRPSEFRGYQQLHQYTGGWFNPFCL